MLLLLASCGTGASPAGGDRDLPNAQAGPFRLLRAGEMKGRAPFVIDRSPPWEGPAALDLDGDPETPGTAVYVSWGTTSTITRFELPDGRSLEGNGVQVLEATEAWEQPGGVRHPAVLREGGEVWMYYEASGCVGRAVSQDGGQTFVKNPTTPVLCGEPGWEGGALGAPSVFRGFDGKIRLLYGASGVIGEAISDDGVAFRRLRGEPLLTRVGAPPLPEGAELDEVFDSAAVGEPDALTVRSALDRPITLIYYTGTNRLGRTAVGLAARLGDDGVASRNPAPVLARHDARGPSALRLAGFTLLYVAGRSSEVSPTWQSVILGAVAPADRSLAGP